MAGKCVKRKQHYVSEQHQRAHANAEAPVEPERAYSVVPEDDQKDKREIKKVAMKILQYKRKAGFTAVAMWSRLTHCACRRIEKEGAVISLAIVVASGPKAERSAQDQNRRGEGPPAMMRINERGVERGKVRAPFIIRAFEGADSS